MPYPTEADLLREEMERATADLAKPKPEAWKPVEGETIAGRLERIEPGHTEWGPRDILILADPDGVERAVWLLQSVLRDEVKKQAPQIGDVVAILYEGKIPRADAPDYHGFKVRVRPAAGGRLEWTDAGAARVGAVARAGEHDSTGGFGDVPAGEAAELQTAELLSCELCGGRLPFHEPGCQADGIPY